MAQRHPATQDRVQVTENSFAAEGYYEEFIAFLLDYRNTHSRLYPASWPDT